MPDNYYYTPIRKRHAEEQKRRHAHTYRLISTPSGIRTRVNGFGDRYAIHCTTGIQLNNAQLSHSAETFATATTSDTSHPPILTDNMPQAILYMLQPPAQYLRRASPLVMEPPRYRIPRLTLQKPHNADQSHSRIRNLQYPRHKLEPLQLHTLQTPSKQPSAEHVRLDLYQRAQPLRFNT